MFKKIFMILSLFTVTFTTAACSSDSLSTNVPKWQGMEVFKHLDDYEAVNVEEYYLRYEGGPNKFYGTTIFKTDIKDSIECTISSRNNPSLDTACHVGNTNINAGLDNSGAEKFTQDNKLNGLYMGKPIKVLQEGKKIFLPKMNSKKFALGVKNNQFNGDENVSLTCVNPGPNSVACINSNKHGFIIENTKTTIF